MSLWANVFLGNLLFGQMFFWANVFWANVLLGKYRSGQMSFWANVFCANVFLGKCLSGQMSSGQMSSGQMSFWANVFLGKCRLGKRPSGQTSYGQMSLGKCIWANIVWVNVMEPYYLAFKSFRCYIEYTAPANADGIPHSVVCSDVRDDLSPSDGEHEAAVVGEGELVVLMIGSVAQWSAVVVAIRSGQPEAETELEPKIQVRFAKGPLPLYCKCKELWLLFLPGATKSHVV
jgi:hypothetical protein